MNKYDYDREKERIVNGLVACIFGLALSMVALWMMYRNIYTMLILLSISLFSSCLFFGIGFLYMKYAAEKVKKWERKKISVVRNLMLIFSTIGAVLGNLIYSEIISRFNADNELNVLTIICIVGVTITCSVGVYAVICLVRLTKRKH